MEKKKDDTAKQAPDESNRVREGKVERAIRDKAISIGTWRLSHLLPWTETVQTCLADLIGSIKSTIWLLLWLHIFVVALVWLSDGS